MKKRLQSAMNAALTPGHCSLALLSFAALAAGCSAGALGGPEMADPSASTTPAAVAPATPSQEEWRRGMSKVPLPKEGCFQASHPSTEWKEVPCGTPPDVPLKPASGHGAATASPETVGGGGGNDLSYGAPGTIFWSEGSFPSVTGVTKETDNGDDKFSIQLNSNTFAVGLCKDSGDPNCTGWQQFVYTKGQVFMQYWLINYPNKCPSPFKANGGNCYRNSTHSISVPSQKIRDLGRLVLAGAAGSTDMVTMWTGDGNVYATSENSLMSLSSNWNVSEFNVFGESDGTGAVFNQGSTIVVQTVAASTGASPTAPPVCDPVSFTGETTNLSVVKGSCCPIGGADPGIWFTESNAANPQAHPCPPLAPAMAGASLAASQQFGVTQTDLFTIGPDGVLNVSWVYETEPWAEPWTIGGSVFPPGAPVAASQQFGLQQTDVFAVDKSGNLDVAWVTGPGVWQGPIGIVMGQFVPGSHLAASRQFGVDQTDVFIVDKNGALTVSWATGAGKWHSQEITAQNLFPPGAPVAASQQFGVDQTDVFVVDDTGTLSVVWVARAGKWQGPVGISAARAFPPGAFLAASQQFGLNQTDVFAVDNAGELEVLWALGAGKWAGPVAITREKSFPAGAPLAASRQFGLDQTDVFVVDYAGKLDVSWVVGAGTWAGPVGISPEGAFPVRAPIAASLQFGTPAQTDVFVIDGNGTRTGTWVIGAGAWQGPRILP